MTIDELDRYKAVVVKAVTALSPNMIWISLGNCTKYLIEIGLYLLYSMYIDICTNILKAVINDMSVNLKYKRMILYTMY